MTPAIDLAKQQRLDYKLHEYAHDERATSYGIEAAQKLGVSTERVFKTLVVVTDKDVLCVAVLPVDSQLSFKKMAKALSMHGVPCKKVQMAVPEQVQRSTGYVLGGVSPLGQKKRLTTLIDESAQKPQTIYVSAGKRGLEIELPAQQLAQTLAASFAAISE